MGIFGARSHFLRFLGLEPILSVFSHFWRILGHFQVFYGISGYILRFRVNFIVFRIFWSLLGIFGVRSHFLRFLGLEPILSVFSHFWRILGHFQVFSGFSGVILRFRVNVHVFRVFRSLLGIFGFRSHFLRFLGLETNMAVSSVFYMILGQFLAFCRFSGVLRCFWG